MVCQCYQIGGPFIAEDPECPQHGRAAGARDNERLRVLHVARIAQQYGSPSEIADALEHVIRYLESM